MGIASKIAETALGAVKSFERSLGRSSIDAALHGNAESYSGLTVRELRDYINSAVSSKNRLAFESSATENARFIVDHPGGPKHEDVYMAKNVNPRLRESLTAVQQQLDGSIDPEISQLMLSSTPRLDTPSTSLSHGRPNRFPPGSTHKNIEQGIFDETINLARRAKGESGIINHELFLSKSKPIESYQLGRLASKVAEDSRIVGHNERLMEIGSWDEGLVLGNDTKGLSSIFTDEGTLPSVTGEGDFEDLLPFSYREASKIIVGMSQTPESLKKTFAHEIGHVVFKDSGLGEVTYLINKLGYNAFAKLVKDELLPLTVFHTRAKLINLAFGQDNIANIENFTKYATSPPELVAEGHMQTWINPQFSKKNLPQWTKIVHDIFSSPRAKSKGIVLIPSVLLPFMLSGAALQGAGNEISDILKQSGPSDYGV